MIKIQNQSIKRKQKEAGSNGELLRDVWVLVAGSG